ncbi:MAG TPA: TrkA family potassium uptake protein [Acidimicrobiales bacterium]|nr:TrkA family potassium uptake protein [Acidimicrobiales bacterium]
MTAPPHVIVVGCGRVGSELATSLVQMGCDTVVMDKSPGAFRRLPPGWGGRTVVGFGFDQDHLTEAGIQEAAALAAVTSGDNSNILTARIARERYEVPQVVARIYDPRRAQIYRRLGIDTVATVTWTVGQAIRRLFPDKTWSDWSDSSGQLLLVERGLPPAWAGQRLERLGARGRLRLVAVERDGQPLLPTPELVGQGGDRLHLAVRKDALSDIDRILTAGPGP